MPTSLTAPAELATLAANWGEQEELLALELEESLTALEAYERQLDAWQKQLVAERAELQTQREEVAEHSANQAALQAQAYDDRAELQLKLKHLANELAAERQTSAVLSTTQLAELADLRSELTDCEYRRQQSDLAAAKLGTEVATLKLRESELAGLLAASQLGTALATNYAAANVNTPQPSRRADQRPPQAQRLGPRGWFRRRTVR